MHQSLFCFRYFLFFTMPTLCCTVSYLARFMNFYIRARRLQYAELSMHAYIYLSKYGLMCRATTCQYQINSVVCVALFPFLGIMCFSLFNPMYFNKKSASCLRRVDIFAIKPNRIYDYSQWQQSGNNRISVGRRILEATRSVAVLAY